MSVHQIIGLTPDEDIASLRERIRRSQANTVVLVVPDNVPVLRQAVSVKLLQRYAEQTETAIIIVTRDRTTEELARRQGLPVYHDLNKIPRRRREGITKDDLAAAPTLPRVPIYRYMARLGCWLMAAIMLAAGIGALVFVGTFLVPSATIYLTPATTTLTTSVNITASPQMRVIDSAKGQLPAKAVQVIIEDTGQMETTGQKRVPDAAATGTVVFANRSLGNITIPKGTTVRTATGVSIRFRTEEEASLPAGAFATVRVPIKAVDPGSTGNVKAGVINTVEGALAFQVSVLNDEETKGGSEKQVRFVTLQDRNVLREAIIQKIRANSYNELRKAIQPDDVLPIETLTLSVNESTFDKPLDAEGQFLTGKVRATVNGLVVDGDDLKTLIAARLRDQIPPGFVLLPEGIAMGAPGNVRYSDGILSLHVQATARSQAQIDERNVQRLAAGKLPDAASALIAEMYALGQPPQISMDRPFLGRLPFFISRIKVIREQ